MKVAAIAMTICFVLVLALTAGRDTRADPQRPSHGSTSGSAASPPHEFGWFGTNRPDSDTAERAMATVRCPCGCPRQSILDCDCRTASDLRHHVIELIAATDSAGKRLYDLSSEAGRSAAYAAVLASFEHEFGRPAIAMTGTEPSWIMPTLAVIAILSLGFALRRRWVSRRPSAAVANDDAEIEDSSRRS